MQARAKNLIQIDERLHRLILPNYSPPQFLLEITRRGTPLSRVPLHVVAPSSLFGIGFDCSIAILVSVLITILYRYLLVTALRCPQAV